MRKYVVLGTLVALAMMTACQRSCRNGGGLPSPGGENGDPPTIVINNSCLAKINGQPANEISANRGHEVCFKNRSPRAVRLSFPPGLFSTTQMTIYVEADEVVCLTVLPDAEERKYDYGFCCIEVDGDCKRGGVGGPKIKVGC